MRRKQKYIYIYQLQEGKEKTGDKKQENKVSQHF